MTVRMPIARSWSKRARMPSLTTSRSSTTPSTCESRATASGVAPARPMRSSAASSSGGAWPPSSVTHRMTASPAPLRSRVPSRSTPLMRVCAVKGTNVAPVRRQLVLAQPVLLGQHDDRAPLRRLVGQRGELRDLREVALGDAGHRHERRGLPVAERDGAGLVEEQDVDVAGRLDRAPGEREDVAAHQPVHARDADRGEQRADGRRDERDEQRDERRDRHRRVREVRERPQRDDHREEDHREADEQDAQGDLVRRPAALGALDERRSCGRGTTARAPA